MPFSSSQPSPRPPASTAEARTTLLHCFQAALTAVNGRDCVRRTLETRPMTGKVWICALGKAAPAMASGALAALPDGCVGGLVVTREEEPELERLRTLGIDCLIGGHPVPNEGSLVAGERLWQEIVRLPADVQVLFLLSGGASSLVEYPCGEIGLEELQRVNEWLLANAFPIGDMNLVRKALSRIKGGGLLQAIGERFVRQLVISDVPGDNPEVIGSGPLVPDAALADRVRRLPLPSWLAEWVEAGLQARHGILQQAPVPELVATRALAAEAAAAQAHSFGLEVWLHPECLTGDAAEQGRQLARTVRSSSGPGLHIWTGETTVQLPEHPGRGGRNQHLALAAALELAGDPDCLLLSAGTDGSDGPTTDAGALVDGDTLARAELEGCDGRDHLERMDSGTLLAASGDLVHTGPTGTNVMDLILGLHR